MKFNPDQPDAGNFPINWGSKPTEGPSADQSTGIALKTIGEGISGAVSIADDLMKKESKREAAVAADATIDIRKTALEIGSKAQSVVPAPVQTPAGSTVANPKTSENQSSLMDANASADVPDSVNEGIDRIDTLTAAKSGGKINDTYYTGQLFSEAKRLRAKYPGYRDYIDQEIHSITGINPAKEYITNLMQDINAQRTAGQKVTDKIYGELLTLNTQGVPGANDAAEHFRATQDIPGALKWINENKSTDYKVKAAEAALALEKNTEEQTARKAEAAFTLKGEGLVNTAWSAASMRAGVDTPQQIQEYVTNAGLGGKPLSTADQQAKALNIRMQRQEMETRLRAMGEQELSVKMANGDIKKMSYAQAMGGSEKFEGRIKSMLGRYDSVLTAITDDKTGTATFSATVNQRVRADYDNGIITNPANEQLLAVDWLTQHAGPQWGNLVTTQTLKANVDSIYSGLLRAKTISAAAGPMPGKPAPSFKEDVEQAKTGVNRIDGKPIDPNTKYFDRLVDNISLLATPTVDTKELAGQYNIAKYFFDPRNREALSNFSLDVWDKEGNKIPGRESVFKTLTTPQVSAQIKRLSEKDPEIARNYKDWIEYEWGQKIFSNHLNQMKDFLDGSATKVFTDPRGVNIAFSDKDNQLYITDNKGNPVNRNIGKTTVEQNYFDFMKRNIDTINGGLQNLSVMHKEFGGDTSAYLLRTMANAGIDASKNKIGQAIINADDERAKKFDETFKKTGIRSTSPYPPEIPIRSPTGALNFTPEEDNSLSNFIRSPAGQAQGAPARKGLIKGNLSDEQVVGMQTTEIPAGMSAREFIAKMKREQK